MKRKLEKHKMKPKTLFAIADCDDSKTISLVELKEALMTVLPYKDCTEGDIVKIMKAFDTNGDQLIDYEEFMNGFGIQSEKKLKAQR